MYAVRISIEHCRSQSLLRRQMMGGGRWLVHLKSTRSDRRSGIVDHLSVHECVSGDNVRHFVDRLVALQDGREQVAASQPTNQTDRETDRQLKSVTIALQRSRWTSRMSLVILQISHIERVAHIK